MRGRAAPPHPSIYRIPPGGVVVSKKTSSVPVNDLIDAQEPKRVAFNRWKASKRERRLFKKTVKKKNSTKLKCCRQKRPWLSMNIPPQYKKKPSLSSPPIEIYRPFEDPYRVFKAQIRCVGVLTLSDLILSTMQCANSY